MKQYYAYNVNRTRAYSAWETGEYTRIFQGEQSLYFSNEYQEEYLTLLGHFHAHDYNDIAGELQVLPNGEVHDVNDLFISVAHFTVAEVAFMLGLSEQRIRALIADKLLGAKKRAGVWLLSGQEVLEFSLKERPAHRPPLV